MNETYRTCSHCVWGLLAKWTLLLLTHQPRLSANPLHNGSVRTILSMSFFHNIPSEITRSHSLQTRSAAHSDLASK